MDRINDLDAAEQAVEPIILTPLECFEDDLELAGSSVEELERALGVRVGEDPPQCAKAYLELLLKLKDNRHEVSGD